MKLSEAIRLGAMLKPQAFGTQWETRLKAGWRGWLLRQRENATCAFAAALDAHPCATKLVPWTESRSLRGLVATDGEFSEALILPQEWQVIYEHRECPACHGYPENVFNLISHLNDTHRWTRERIADWVEAIESGRQLASEPARATNAVREDSESPVFTLRAS